jgi:hypothetical protein
MRTLWRRWGTNLKTLLLPIAISSLTVAVAQIGGAFGQARTNPLIITVPGVFEAEAASETPLPIRVMPESAVPKQAIVLIRGLPPTVALSEGRLFQSGIWALRINDLPGLTIAAPTTPGVKSQLSISVVMLDGAVLAETKSALLITSPHKAAKAAPATPAGGGQITTAAVAPPVEPSQSAPRPAAKTLSPEQKQTVEMLMSKGEENVRGGQVNVARLFYKRAADMGWAPGAMALAGTYDASELERIGTLGGVQPDAKLAKQWYEKARDLGAAEAQNRLTTLGTR